MARVNTISSLSELHTFTKTGVVVGHQVWSETLVRGHSSGGGGVVYNGIGHVNGPDVRISSKSVEVTRLFIREDDGDEFDVKLYDLGGGVREGHKVTILYAGDTRSKNGYDMGLVNHDTKQSHILKGRAEHLIHRVSPFAGLVLVVATAGVIMAVLHAAIGIGMNWPAAFLACVPAVVLLARRRHRNDGIKYGIARRLREMAQEALARA